MTVNGALDAHTAGYILPHEHLLVDFIGAQQVSTGRYAPQAVIDQMLPYLKEAKAAGCSVFFDCTPAYLGRDVRLLQQLAQQSGVHIITNTGYYSAVQHKYLPAHAFTETAAQLAQRWISEAVNGIDNTGIKPGFIKISVDKHPLDDIDKKIVQAAAMTHIKTGLTIGSHTGSGKAALEQLDILADAGVDESAFVWIHAQAEKDRALQVSAGRRGAWISFDNLGWEPVSAFLDHISFMQQSGLLKQLLLSHDAGWYDVEQKGKNKIKPFTPLFTDLMPVLQQQGWKKEALLQLFHHNPAEAFHIHKRLKKQRL